MRRLWPALSIAAPLALLLFGCAWYPAYPAGLNDIYRKGGPDKVAAWTLKQTDGDQILRGLDTLRVHMHQHESRPGAPDAYVRVVGKLEAGWPGLVMSRDVAKAARRAERFRPETPEDWLIRSSYFRLASSYALNRSPLVKETFLRLRPQHTFPQRLQNWDEAWADGHFDRPPVE